MLSIVELVCSDPFIGPFYAIYYFNVRTERRVSAIVVVRPPWALVHHHPYHHHHLKRLQYSAYILHRSSLTASYPAPLIISALDGFWSLSSCLMHAHCLHGRRAFDHVTISSPWVKHKEQKECDKLINLNSDKDNGLSFFGHWSLKNKWRHS